jgi:hypothetical protein
LRKREREKLIEKMQTKEASYGRPLYFRPFERDDRVISEISKTTGEKKSAVAQKLIHLAVRGKQYDFARQSRDTELLEWLVASERRKKAKSDELSKRIGALEDRLSDNDLKLETILENTSVSRTLLIEIFCMMSVTVSYLNLIFTKIIELLSPSEIERKNSSDFANRNIYLLIEHSLSEIEHLSLHHGFDPEEETPEMLYLATKLEKIRDRIEGFPEPENPQDIKQ